MASALGPSNCSSGRGGYSSSGSGEGVEISATAFCSRSASVGAAEEAFFLLEVAGWEGLVTLLVLGPKARVCWARAAEPEGLRRVGGMLLL